MGASLHILEIDTAAALAGGGFASFEDYVDCKAGERISRTRTSETRRIELPGAPPGPYYLKIYRYRSRRGLFPDRRDKAAIEVRNYAILHDDCGIHVPDLVAYGTRRRGRRLVDGFILTRAVPEGVGLDALAAERWPDPDAAGGDSLRGYLLRATADLVRRMHAVGFCHVDLQWRNIIVALDGSDAPPVYLIDSARGGRRVLPTHRHHGRIRDLSSLFKTARDRLTVRERLRWLRDYLGVDHLRHEHHALIHAIEHDRAIKG